MGPDKGGDVGLFDEIKKAYAVLEDETKRDAYDEELAKQRERALLVEGAPAPKDQTAGSASVARVKTEPTPGSKRSMARQAKGWKIHGTGIEVLKAIEDGATPEQKAETLFNKFETVPKSQRKDWMKTVKGAD